MWKNRLEVSGCRNRKIHCRIITEAQEKEMVAWDRVVAENRGDMNITETKFRRGTARISDELKVGLWKIELSIANRCLGVKSTWTSGEAGL